MGSARRTSTKRFKRLVAGIVFAVMGRGLVSCARVDSRVSDEVAEWPDGTTITLAIAPGSPRVTLRYAGGRLESLGSRSAWKPTLAVTFKNVDAALPVLLGMRGMLEAFAEHRATVAGDLGLAMSVVRCVHIVEDYLYPGIMTRRILPRPATRVAFGHARAYAGLLAGSAKVEPKEREGFGVIAVPAAMSVAAQRPFAAPDAEPAAAAAYVAEEGVAE